jgi:uncharacterized membrane protein
MSKLLAMIFDGPHKADEVRTMLYRMKDDCRLDIEETAVIATYGDGSTRFSQDANFFHSDQRIVRRVGLLTAAIAGMPSAVMTDSSDARWVERLVDQTNARKFINSMKRELKPRTSALLTFVTAEQREKFVQPLRQWYPRLLEFELPCEPDWETEVRLAWSRGEFTERRRAYAGRASA